MSVFEVKKITQDLVYYLKEAHQIIKIKTAVKKSSKGKGKIGKEKNRKGKKSGKGKKSEKVWKGKNRGKSKNVSK